MVGNYRSIAFFEAKKRCCPPYDSLSIVHCPLKQMPLYEYRCDSCGDFEAWRSMSDYKAPIACPDCDLPAIKIFSPPHINLNSGSLSKIASNSSEPRLVKSEARKQVKPRYQSSNSKRPWMISHAKAI